jgi:hypothetical protein
MQKSPSGWSLGCARKRKLTSGESRLFARWRWRTVRDTGVTRYQVNGRGKRRATQRGGGYQPIGAEEATMTTIRIPKGTITYQVAPFVRAQLLEQRHFDVRIEVTPDVAKLLCKQDTISAGYRPVEGLITDVPNIEVKR